MAEAPRSTATPTSRTRSRRFSDEPERGARLVVFSNAITTELIGWDLREVTDRRCHECAVYEIVSGDGPGPFP